MIIFTKIVYKNSKNHKLKVIIYNKYNIIMKAIILAAGE
jgi:hypothetical protein